MVILEPSAARHRNGWRGKDTAGDNLKKPEPLYSVQRMACEEAAKQALVNLFRRLIGLSVKKTSQEAEFEVLDGHRVPRTSATWARGDG